MAISAILRSLALDPSTSGRLAFTGDEDVTYLALVSRAEHAARLMRDLGVRRGDVVGTVLYNESTLYSLLIASCMIGASILPLSPRQRPAERDALLARTRAAVCWTRGAFEDVPSMPVLDVASLDGTFSDPYAEDDARADDVCWIATTGGSTGLPKLYAVSQSNLLSNLLINTADWGLDRHGTHVSVAPLAHGIGFCNALAQVLHGGTVHLNARLVPEQALAALAAFPSAWTALVPTILYDLIEAAEGAVPSLELIVCAGSTLSPKVRQRVGSAFPRADIREYYGTTEMGWVTSQTSAEWSEAPGTVGLPTRGTRVRIAGPDGVPLATGTTGEVFASGRPYAVGRFEDLASGHRIDWPDWVSAGDRGFLDENGRLHLVGRLDDLIIVGGLNVDPVEIVHHLCEHPQVSAAVVEGVPDERLGQRIHAYIETDRDDVAFTEELTAFARAHMAAYKVPSTFDLRRRLPRTAAGKVSLALLKEEVRKP